MRLAGGLSNLTGGRTVAGLVLGAMFWLSISASAQEAPGSSPPDAGSIGASEPAVTEPGAAAPSEAPAPPAPADSIAACTKADFETVVDQAAAALRDLNQLNKPKFQEKLRVLKDKRAWSEDQFLNEAAPFVKDEQIDGYDARTHELLGQITAMGDEGSAAASPNCALFQTLRGHMNMLVETQNAKWTYMFSKIDAELAK